MRKQSGNDTNGCANASGRSGSRSVNEARLAVKGVKIKFCPSGSAVEHSHSICATFNIRQMLGADGRADSSPRTSMAATVRE